MKIKDFKASERGSANYGWLKANYSFSFANYLDRDKINFGALRVLNDDIIKGDKGFETHPHNNMEIITIPLSGSLKHKDSMSDKWIPIATGEVQVMSAGTGIIHSERNNSLTDSINLFQIWINPDTQSVKPSYSQMKFDPKDRINKLQLLVSSKDNSDVKSLKINQDAKISRLDLDNGLDFTYDLKSKNHGVYILLISGNISIIDKVLERRDAWGVSKTDSFVFRSNLDSEILFIEVPMNY